jgi:hypothetical protein
MQCLLFLQKQTLFSGGSVRFVPILLQKSAMTVGLARPS